MTNIVSYRIDHCLCTTTWPVVLHMCGALYVLHVQNMHIRGVYGTHALL